MSSTHIDDNGDLTHSTINKPSKHYTLTDIVGSMLDNRCIRRPSIYPTLGQ